jgi:hypothetical protein
MPKDKRLERLDDYTKFHIGIYLSIGGAIVALLGSDKASWLVKYFGGNRDVLLFALLFMVIAGFAGGVIASGTTSCETFDEFWKKPQGPVVFKWFDGIYWTYVEHVSFWISLGLVACAILTGP